MPQSYLLKKCNEYLKLSSDIRVSKVSVIDNDNPFLLKLTSLKDFDQRVELADKCLKKIGEGSSRVIFKLSGDNVVKIAKNKKGIVQNLQESRPKMQRECTNRILLADPKGIWIIVKFAKKISKDRFKKLVGFEFDEFTKSLMYKFNNESDDWKKPKSSYNAIQKNPLFMDLVSLVVDCDLQLGDVDRIDSWGEVDGKPVLMDYGLTRDVYDKYYA